MTLIVGAFLALATTLLGRSARMDRDRAFYPTVTIVVASYYVLFAVMGGSDRALAIEACIGAVFAALAVAGFRWSLWLVAAALAAHGLFDFLRGTAIANPGVPVWWPGFCLGYDLTAAACLAWLLGRGRIRATFGEPHRP